MVPDADGGDSGEMRGLFRRLYWAVLTAFSLFLVYEALTRQIYGDNSFWLAVVFSGVAVLSCLRLASIQ